VAPVRSASENRSCMRRAHRKRGKGMREKAIGIAERERRGETEKKREKERERATARKSINLPNERKAREAAFFAAP